ncbi:MAG: sulfatase, partial [Planctomycetes bacterium]|nr:sulfatase [Planctomycetota bacterium]
LLFDLSKDIGERKDLAASMPEETKKLRQRLDTYLTAVNAQLPTPNPNYDPNQSTDSRRGNKGGKPGGKGKPQNQ